MGSRAETIASGRVGLWAWRLIVVWLAMSSIKTQDAMAQVRGPIPNGRLTSGTLSFDGHATVGDFTGTTKTMAGQITGATDISGVRGWVEAPVQSLKTGDRKR